MIWLETEGGPFIFAEDEHKCYWKGVEENDFEEACDVEGYLGEIQKQNGQFLVLGDEPLRTSMFSSSSIGFCFVRWEWADSEELVEVLMNNFDPLICEKLEEDYVATFRGGMYSLFDSVNAGCAAESIQTKLQKGRYCISTYKYEPDDRTSLIVHQFLLI